MSSSNSRAVTYDKYASVRGFFFSRFSSKYCLFSTHKQKNSSKYRCFYALIHWLILHSLITNKKAGRVLGFLFGRVPVATGLRLFAAADVVTATAVHDEKPRKNITDIATTATDQEKDENVVIATASTICTTVCKEAVHYVNPLCYLDCSYCTIRNQKFLCSLFLQFG